MTEYEVQMDVTMSGSFYVYANSEKEAREKIKEMYPVFVPSDLRFFHEIGREIVDLYETETRTFGDVWDRKGA